MALNPLTAMGKAPSGERLKRCQQASNYKDGAFQNLAPTKMFVRNTGIPKMVKTMASRPSDSKPPGPLPVEMLDWAAWEALGPEQKSTHGVWFGHSSYAIRLNGKTILVDPVLSGSAAPVSFAAAAFSGADPWQASELPHIDILLITHDHYDHLDAETIIALEDRVDHVITSLGVGSHLEHWGYAADKITELGWDESCEPLPGFQFTAVTARHFSGRSLQRANTLWSAFVLNTPAWKGFIGGDSGYGEHFARIGRDHGPFDYAWMECGQYGTYWPLIHMTPEQTVRAALDLGVSLAQPVHWGKFALAMHGWNEPIRRFVEAAESANLNWTAPVPGRMTQLGQERHISPWWNLTKNTP